MTQPADAIPLPRRSRLTALLEHVWVVEDLRDVRRILHPLPEILLLVVCGTIADCDSLPRTPIRGLRGHRGLGRSACRFASRQHLPYEHGALGERWLTILMNRVNPGLFSAAFSDWVRESWPDMAGLMAIDGIAGGPWRQWRRVSPRRFAAQP